LLRITKALFINILRFLTVFSFVQSNHLI